MTTESIDPGRGFDRMFAGANSAFVDRFGRSRPLDVDQWRADPDAADLELFVAPCTGPTIDIGCGPGRIAAALSERSIHAMGIDTSMEAIRQARERGAIAMLRDVFDHLPGEGRWDFALLADGNVGIGGSPVVLLRRVAQLLRPGGSIIVEVGAHGLGLTYERIRLRVDSHLSAPFNWASVGLDAIGSVAAASGLDVVRTHTVGNRHAATLRTRAAT
ncbi:class I SAM-dependent methyltransferase [soil metagenome]